MGRLKAAGWRLSVLSNATRAIRAAWILYQEAEANSYAVKIKTTPLTAAALPAITNQIYI
ncbi:hypothetical protein GCM10011382_13460 [Vreelandella lutescens]|uniref:Uncharacterized protein n=1 Tax=Vreelandella lutescens TaxID=1602943 RepID=A0ABQ1NT86_9GAMM|nr:hypothetical protein GCM10011382_13460 [Halomonas lutescens]